VAEKLLAVAPDRGRRHAGDSAPEFASFFGPPSLAPLGVADAREWHPDHEQPTSLPPRPGQSLVGVARVE
jgi:hypothetical protein